LEELRFLLLPWYLQIKFFHLLMVAMWSFSTAVAFRDYLAPVFRAWSRNPERSDLIARRDEAIERFDNGAVLEHIAFPLVLFTGLLMVWLGSWTWEEVNWLTIKLGIVLIVFLPMEILDYYLSHFGGNKGKIRTACNTQRYEQMILLHWKFLRVSTPLAIVFIPALFYLAVTKPV
jgi:hypothetical protein